MRIARTAALALALLLAGGLTACGDDDDASNAVDEIDDSSSGDDADSDDDADSGVGFGAGECAEFARALAAAGAAAGGQGDFEGLAEFFEEAADEAPEEIQDAMAVVADAYTEFAERLREAGVDLSDPDSLHGEALEALTAAGEAIDTPEVNAATEEISAFAEAGCE